MVVFLALLVQAHALINASLLSYNNSEIDYLRYDRSDSYDQGLRYGSDSYMDHTRTNPDAFLYLCHPNLSVGHKADLAYTSFSGNLTQSLLQFLPQIHQVQSESDPNGTYYCTTIDVDLSSSKSLFPGLIQPLFWQGNISYSSFPYLSQRLNGSYDIGITIEGPPKTFYLSASTVYDENEQEISKSAPQLLFSIVNGSNHSIMEKRVSPREQLAYSGQILGGEKVYVNGMLSLEIQTVQPCSEINESGYYILNASLYNHSQSCFTLNNTQDISINFGDELIDGDDSLNGSKQEGVCSITIENSKNITLENLQTQQFYNGLCITNSTVNLFGIGSVENINGAQISSSVVTISNVLFRNNNTDISATNSSRVTLVNVSVDTAQISSEFTDSSIKGISAPPNPPSSSLSDINQWIEYTSTGNESWAQISFHYPKDIPNNVIADNISIYKYNGTYERYNQSLINETDNSTYQVEQQDWINGNWTQLYTIISPSDSLIIGPNISSFSVFAPFGFEGDPEPEPDPTPEPVSVSSPSAGSGGGGGATPSRIGQKELPRFAEAVELELSLPDNITLMQGEAGEVVFNLSNKGEVNAFNITVSPRVLRGWDSTNASIASLLALNSTTGTFQIAPYEKALAQTYYIPVFVDIKIAEEQVRAITQVMKVIVIPRGTLKRIKVIEYPPVIEMEPFSTQTVSFLVDNIGDLDLKNVTIQHDPSECLTNITGSNSIQRGETKSFLYTFTVTDKGVCDYNIKMYEEGELVGFVPVTFVIEEPVLWQKEIVRYSILLIIVALWTVLTVYILRRKKAKFEEEDQ